MMCVFNFFVGFVVMFEEVLWQVVDEMFDWYGSGMSVMEMSYCGKEFMLIYEVVLIDLCDLFGVLVSYWILFL